MMSQFARQKVCWGVPEIGPSKLEKDFGDTIQSHVALAQVKEQQVYHNSKRITMYYNQLNRAIFAGGNAADAALFHSRRAYAAKILHKIPPSRHSYYVRHYSCSGAPFRHAPSGLPEETSSCVVLALLPSLTARSFSFLFHA